MTNIERRLQIAESALWILADKYIDEGCFDRYDKTATDVVSQCRWQAERNIQKESGSNGKDKC